MKNDATVLRHTLFIQDFIKDREDRINSVNEFKKTNTVDDKGLLDSIIAQYENEITMAKRDIDYISKNPKKSYDCFYFYKLKLEGKNYANEKAKPYSI